MWHQWHTEPSLAEGFSNVPTRYLLWLVAWAMTFTAAFIILLFKK